MKIIVNRCWGGFEISEKAQKLLGNFESEKAWEYECSKETRTDKRLIDLLEKKGTNFVSGRNAELRIVEIPDESTDYIINDYDGMESVIYVYNGKICYGKTKRESDVMHK